MKEQLNQLNEEFNARNIEMENQNAVMQQIQMK